MLVDIQEIRQSQTPLFVELDLTAADVEGGEDLGSLLEPVHFACRVSVAGERVRVVGGLTALLELTCSRCLGRFPRRVEEQFDLEYQPDPEVESEDEEISLTYDELAVGFYRGGQLDLAAVAAEQVFLEVPMKPVCKEACKGLCDQCGADLNEGPCGCDKTRLDPRLEALAGLKKRFKNKL